MNNSISYCASNKKQLIRLQARARRVCRMFGLAPLEQAKVISVLFEMAYEMLKQQGEVKVSFQLTNETIEVRCKSGDSRNIQTNGRDSFSIKLPPRRERLALEDVFWTLQELDEMDEPSVFDEIRQQSNDLLRAILEVEKLSPEVLRRSGNPHAA